MLSALLVALREGVEAALVVGIVLVYLNRTGRRALAPYAWMGVGAAVACSFVAAVLLQRWQVNEDGFEGLMMIVAAVLVVTMIIWMNRIARSLKKEIEQRVEGYAQRTTRAAGIGIAVFVFTMVLREGAELVLILRAVELSSAGIEVWIGTGIGILLSILVGLFFFQGTLKIPLGRFFAVTSTILMVVAFQLALTGIHELSEAQWIWSSKFEMATIGPIVRNEVFFFVVILGVAALAVLREWFAASKPGEDAALNPAEKRRRDWEFRKQRRWSFAAAFLCIAVILMFTAEFVYARTAAAPPAATPLEAVGGRVEIAVSEVGDSNLHFYTADSKGTLLRFLVIRKGNGDYAVALDACQICGWSGYRQQGQSVICRNCGAAIYVPSIGQSGGCNPVAVKARVEAGKILIDLAALTQSAATVQK
jgi:FTR1 family protein